MLDLRRRYLTYLSSRPDFLKLWYTLSRTTGGTIATVGPQVVQLEAGRKLNCFISQEKQVKRLPKEKEFRYCSTVVFVVLTKSEFIFQRHITCTCARVMKHNNISGNCRWFIDAAKQNWWYMRKIV